MTARCPTCAKPLGGDTITDRLLALLAQSPRPLASVEIARSLGAQRTTIYQTTRRLADRGSIRRSVVQGVTGWVLVSHSLPEQGESPSPDESRLSRAMADLVGYVIASGSVSRADGERYLDALGVGDAMGTGEIVSGMVESGLLAESGGYLTSTAHEQAP